MRAKRPMRAVTATRLAVGAAVLACPATALAVTDAAGQPAPVPAADLHAHAPAHVRYGTRTTVRGSAPAADAGEPVVLDYRPAGARAWQTVARGQIHPGGAFALTARIARSGSLQVRPAAPARSAEVATAATTAAAPAPTITTAATTTAATPATSTDPEPATSTAAAPTTTTSSPAARTLAASRVTVVRVGSRLALADRTVSAVAGTPARIHGSLLPARAGRRVVLDALEAGHWRRVASARTGRRGHFTLRYVPDADSASQLVHATFAGDRLNGGARSHTVRVAAMQYAEVSWYDDAGDTACGFHATYGIASRTLPCGTQVTLSYGGRTVVATVDDRGPFVYSRLYDLNQNVAAALGMYGVATVLASV